MWFSLLHQYSCVTQCFKAVFTFVYMAEYTLKQSATDAIIECNVQLFIPLLPC